IELSGPSGWRQFAPCTQRHQAERSLSGTGPEVGVNTSAPAASALSSGLGVPGGSSFFKSSQSILRSAVVTYPVASTNFENSALVTSCSSIQKPWTSTRWAGRSFGKLSLSLVPIRNAPLGIQTIAGGAFLRT